VPNIFNDLFQFKTTFYDHFNKFFFFNSDHADELLSGKYLNDSQCTHVKPVEVRNVYDFPFGAKKKGLTPRSIDASENKLKSVLLRSLSCPSYLLGITSTTLCFVLTCTSTYSVCTSTNIFKGFRPGCQDSR
jgi:hypothetical protein